MKSLLTIQLLLFSLGTFNQSEQPLSRERNSINEGWQFFRYHENPDTLIYDERPEIKDKNDSKVADTKASESQLIKSSSRVLKEWILPTANNFIKDTSKWHLHPQDSPGENFPFVQNDFNDQDWESVILPHDWAIDQPFYKEGNAIIGGGMGRLPVHGVAWYRKK